MGIFENLNYFVVAHWLHVLIFLCEWYRLMFVIDLVLFIELEQFGTYLQINPEILRIGLDVWLMSFFTFFKDFRDLFYCRFLLSLLWLDYLLDCLLSFLFRCFFFILNICIELILMSWLELVFHGFNFEFKLIVSNFFLQFFGQKKLYH